MSMPNPINGVESGAKAAWHGIDSGWHDLFGSSSPAPQPARYTPRALPQSVWRAQPSGASGQVTVNRDVLVKTAAQINGIGQDIAHTLAQLNAAAPGGTSVTGWPTANGFSGNVSTVSQAVSDGSTQAVTAHQDAAGNLTATATSYDTAETDTTTAINGIAAQLGIT